MTQKEPIPVMRLPGWTADVSLSPTEYKYHTINQNFSLQIIPQLHGCDFVCNHCWECIRLHGQRSCDSICQACWTCDPIPHNWQIIAGVPEPI